MTSDEQLCSVDNTACIPTEIIIQKIRDLKRLITHPTCLREIIEAKNVEIECLEKLLFSQNKRPNVQAPFSLNRLLDSTRLKHVGTLNANSTNYSAQICGNLYCDTIGICLCSPVVIERRVLLGRIENLKKHLSRDTCVLSDECDLKGADVANLRKVLGVLKRKLVYNVFHPVDKEYVSVLENGGKVGDREKVVTRKQLFRKLNSQHTYEQASSLLASKNLNLKNDQSETIKFYKSRVAAYKASLNDKLKSALEKHRIDAQNTSSDTTYNSKQQNTKSTIVALHDNVITENDIIGDNHTVTGRYADEEWEKVRKHAACTGNNVWKWIPSDNTNERYVKRSKSSKVQSTHARRTSTASIQEQAGKKKRSRPKSKKRVD